MLDQMEGDRALKRGYAEVRQYAGGKPSFAKLVFGHPTKVEDERSRNSIFILSINGQEYAFDKEELLYWLRYV